MGECSRAFLMGLWPQHGPDASRAVAVGLAGQEGLRYVRQAGESQMDTNPSLLFLLPFKEICLFLFCVCVSTCVRVYYICIAHRGQKRAWGRLELDFQSVVSHHVSAGNQSQALWGASSVLSHYAISPVPIPAIFNICIYIFQAHCFPVIDKVGYFQFKNLFSWRWNPRPWGGWASILPPAICPPLMFNFFFFTAMQSKKYILWGNTVYTSIYLWTCNWTQILGMIFLTICDGS